MKTIRPHFHPTEASRHFSILCSVVPSLVICGVICGAACTTWGADRRKQALDIKSQLVQKVLPYWYDTTVDGTNGGFILADDGTANPKPATEKMLVTQARMIWGFSHAHIKGLEDGRRDYLAAAAQGRQFLHKYFRDAQHGGYFWTTDLQGSPLNRSKIIYAQAFVIYGLVEYYRASGDKSALTEAMDLYRVLGKRAHDPRNGGWGEHFAADWSPILLPGRGAAVEIPGYKSANAHLHLMEAFTELYEATNDKAVRGSLEEALDICMKYFYPRDAGRSCFHRHPDWSPVKTPASAGLSYGHNVEFAWLMIRAQQVLKQKPSWGHFQAHIDHALKYGYDHERGGVYSQGLDHRPATNTDKVWWVQSEMMAALTDSLKHKENSAHSAALDSLMRFINEHQADPKDGIWFDTVTAEGQPKNPSKAHNWKGNYHDVRALVKFIDAFSEAR